MPRSKIKKAKSLVTEGMSGYRSRGSFGSLVSGDEEQETDDVINDSEEDEVVAELKTYIRLLLQK